jgi:hypothetical protein
MPNWLSNVSHGLHVVILYFKTFGFHKQDTVFRKSNLRIGIWIVCDANVAPNPELGTTLILVLLAVWNSMNLGL